MGEEMKYIKVDDVHYIIISQGAAAAQNGKIDPVELATFVADILERLPDYVVDGISGLSYEYWDKDGKSQYSCSGCGYEPKDNKVIPYCPYCGAPMERNPRIVS